ncbi:hypothetical protein RYX45_07050 [Alkalihalophilus pseudofirmus]|uniref:ParB/Sulfiredoxin domain-containing protein n=1 Tax=Alkalihalophilus pseudofirmus TaxID=79885 RepID=A0AAJ2NL24_ALKPS|nr:hypothetical protein [Alkalihalophilus pseudofirmus]MDV2884931.1 hypothetical protein [Alkalihalophilus pseudofirmus]
MKNMIEAFERESREFNPSFHFKSRIKEMEKTSSYGVQLASKWRELLNRSKMDEVYPVVHPIGKETFSLYADYPSGIFEYALDIDLATSLIREKAISPINVSPKNIIDAVDPGNINKDPAKIKPNHKNPVMVIQSHYLTNNKYYCINGNHRIYEAYRNEDEEIEVYLFKELEFVSFFYDELSKATYFLEIDAARVLNNQQHIQQSELNQYPFDFNFSR